MKVERHSAVRAGLSVKPAVVVDALPLLGGHAVHQRVVDAGLRRPLRLLVEARVVHEGDLRRTRSPRDPQKSRAFPRPAEITGLSATRGNHGPPFPSPTPEMRSVPITFQRCPSPVSQAVWALVDRLSGRWWTGCLGAGGQAVWARGLSGRWWTPGENEPGTARPYPSHPRVGPKERGTARRRHGGRGTWKGLSHMPTMGVQAALL